MFRKASEDSGEIMLNKKKRKRKNKLKLVSKPNFKKLKTGQRILKVGGT